MDRILKILPKVLLVLIIVLVITTLAIYVIKSSKKGPTGGSSNQNGPTGSTGPTGPTGSTGTTGPTGSTGPTGVPTGCKPISGPTGTPNSTVPIGMWNDNKYKFQSCPTGPIGCLDITNYNDNTPMFRGMLLDLTYTNINKATGTQICPANATFDTTFSSLTFDDTIWNSTKTQVPKGIWNYNSNIHFTFILNRNGVWVDIINLSDLTIYTTSVLLNNTFNSAVVENILKIPFPGTLDSNTITWYDNSTWKSILTTISGLWRDVTSNNIYTFQSNGPYLDIFNENKQTVEYTGTFEGNTYSFNYNNHICTGTFSKDLKSISWDVSPFYKGTWIFITL